MEIERKFLVKSLPSGLKNASVSKIRQGYFPLRGTQTEVRLREKDSKHFITIKAGSGTARLEEEIGISKDCFKKLWPLVRDASLVKKRYRIRHGERTIELDVYEGRHRGLRTAEVEFPSQQGSKNFVPPDWLGREITGHRRYANESLARRGHI